MDAPSLEGFKVRLEGTLNSLILGKGVLAHGRGVGTGWSLKVSSNPNQYMILWFPDIPGAKLEICFSLHWREYSSESSNCFSMHSFLKNNLFLHSKYTNGKTTFVFYAAFRESNFTNASKVLNSRKDKTGQECVMSSWGATWKKCTHRQWNNLMSGNVSLMFVLVIW